MKVDMPVKKVNQTLSLPAMSLIKPLMSYKDNVSIK